VKVKMTYSHGLVSISLPFTLCGTQPADISSVNRR
jgi:hypothetical protein